MEQNNIPTFNRLDFWYAQLYSWIHKDPSKREEVTKTIINECTNQMTTLKEVVNGEFRKPDPIEDLVSFIRFPELSFNLNVDDRKIECTAKIRINPCIKLSLFNIDAGEETKNLDRNIISERLKIEFKNKKIPLSENPIISKEKEGMWVITDNEKAYFVRKENRKLDIFDKAAPPFFSKIWVIISTISESIGKYEHFKLINEIAKNLCDETAKMYLGSLGGAEKESESPLLNIKIKSMASSDKRLLGLMYDRDALDQLSKELGRSDYLNKALDAVLTNLCENLIEDWRKHRNYDCIRNADWRLVRSGNTKGLYSTRQERDNTIISAVFYSPDQPNYEPVANILHEWGVDLSVVL